MGVSIHSFVERARIPVSRILAGILLVVLLFSYSKWEGVSIVSDVLFVLGCILAGIGSLGRLWCSLYIAGYKNHTLVTDGPYSISRNPLYFFNLVGGCGVGLATETALIPIVILFLFAIYYPSVIRSEEKRLLELHGDKFESYCKHTPVFFPKPSLLKEPDACIVNPRIFRKNLLGAIWFIWFLGLLEVIEELHETGVLPVLFRIY